MAEPRDDASHDPTAQRMRRAEQTGQFARSRELATAMTWLGGVALLVTFGDGLWHSLQRMAITNWTGGEAAQTPANQLLREQWASGQSVFQGALLPILGGLAAIALLSHFVQGGFRFLPHLASPDPGRISPRRNLGRLLGAEAFVSTGLGLVKLAGLMVIAGWVLLGDLTALLELGQGRMRQNSAAMTDWVAAATMRLCVASVITGLVDYGIRWQLNRRSLRMTGQEVRDEQRSMEPSPEVAARRRLRQRS